MTATDTWPAKKSFLEFKMKKIIFAAALILASSPFVFAEEWNKSRDFAVDQELSEMKSASVILPPGKHAGGNLNPKTGQIPGLGLSDAGATAKGSSSGIGQANTNSGNSGTASPAPSDNSGAPSSGGESGAGVDADLNVGTGGTIGDSTENVLPDSETNLPEETPTVGLDVSGGEDYLISADASVGETEVSADVIPSDSFDDTIVGETADFGAEIDASGDLSGSEAEIGIEADVDGSVADESIANDPADGLSLTSSTGL